MTSRRPDKQEPGLGETGGYQGDFQVAPVSRVWLDALAEIDASWNSNPWSQSAFEVELANPTAQVWGIFCDHHLVGYLVAHVVLDSAHIVSIAVAKPWRRQGLGGMLLRHFLEEVEASGVSVVTLEVRASNELARRLYSGVGFEPVGIRREYYTNNNEDAVIMRRICRE